jgi:hypothetical protein
MRLIDQWNGLDTSQITTTPAFASAGQTCALSVVTSTSYPFGRLLRFDGGGSTTGSRAVVVLFTEPLDIENSGPIYVELDIVTISAMYAGPSFFGDLSGGPGHYYGYNYVFGAAGWRSRVDDGVLNIAGSTSDQLLTNATAGRVGILINGHKAASARPKFILDAFEVISATGNKPTAYIRQNAWNGEPAGSGWHPLACDRWGICLQASGGATLGTLDLAGWRVYDFLADGGVPDTTPPAMTYDPANGAQIERDDPIAVNVSAINGIRLVTIGVEFPETGKYEVVWDGVKFAGQYGTSEIAVVSETEHDYTIRRSGSWPARPRVVCRAVDLLGNLG